MKKLKLYKIDNEEKNEKREHGTDIPNNENNLSLIFKWKRFDNDEADANSSFVSPLPYKYKTERKVTKMINELHGKTYFLKNDNIIWTSSIVTDDIKL